MQCPLCHGSVNETPIRAHRRAYFDCFTCGLIFLDPTLRLGPEEERAHYLTHQNDPRDLRYREFLDRLAIPLIAKLASGACGLDMGSGPGPTLSLMLEERGFPMETYDPYFAPNPRVLERTYDFITVTETAEHFYEPGVEFARLDKRLRPHGILAVMTEMRRDDRPFEQWHYPRDPTHVSFYRRQTMEWIAKNFGWELEIPRANVVLFKKTGAS